MAHDSLIMGDSFPGGKRQQCERLRVGLSKERSSFLPLWKELADNLAPRRYQQYTATAGRGDKRNQAIIDSSPLLSVRTMRAGMMAGITSPARPWKKLTTSDIDLSETPAVKRWLDVVNKRMDSVFQRSNLYNSLPNVYGDEGVFGIAAMSVLEDEKDVIRTHVLPVGSFMCAINARGIVDTLVREIPMTVRQIVGQFVDMSKPPSSRWSNVSANIRSLWDAGNLDARVDVSHCVRPNADYREKYSASKDKQYASLYFEHGSDSEDRMLSESGYDTFPFLVPRWEVTGTDVYGTSCPGMDALGDTKALQLMQRRKAEAIEKMVRPPMIGPAALRNAKASILPNDITYLDVRDGQQGFKPIYEVNPRIAELIADLQETQKRVSRVFYEDLFLMMVMSDRRNITATEVSERQEEKLLMLGPTLERNNDELLDPLIDRVFDIMAANGMIPEPPEELQGQPLKVEYISIMAQAQRMIASSSLERFTRFVGGVAQMDPTVLDGINGLEIVREYGGDMGVQSKILNTDDEIAVVRQQRAKAQQVAAQMEMMKTMAGAAKDLGQVPTSGDNAAAQLLGAAQQGQGQAA